MSRRDGATEPVVVVGAGLAGLHAASRLHASGIDVVVLEASDRVGGRIWSAALANGRVVERGGEFIAPTDECLRSLCAELGLELVPHGFSFDRRTVPGQDPPTEEDIVALVAEAQARTLALDRDVAAEAVLSPPGRRNAIEASIIRRLETSLTVPLAEVSARRLFTGGKGSYDPAARVREGNDAVARRLAARLGVRVRLRTPVVAVYHRPDGTTVHVADGTAVAAAAVVLALPLPRLMRLVVRPALPAAIVIAAQRLRFGDAAKLHIPLGAGARVGGVASPDGLWWCWVSRAPNALQGASVLSAFAGGSVAVRAVGADRGPGNWEQQALELRPDVEAAGGSFVTHWGASRWTGGSYSVPGVGLTAEDEAAWTRPWGSLVFAGEHTAGAAAGSMNGAALSGARAARAIAELIGVQADV